MRMKKVHTLARMQSERAWAAGRQAFVLWISFEVAQQLSMATVSAAQGVW